MDQHHVEMLETGLWAAGISAIAATARIIARKLPFQTAFGTLFIGMCVGILAGVITNDMHLENWVQNTAISISSVSGKELTELIIRVMGSLQSKSGIIADKIIEKVSGESKNDR